MKTKKHPDAKLTLREAYEKHYDKSELASGSLSTFQAMLRRWEQHTDNPPVGDADDTTMRQFKDGLCAGNLAPASINNYLRHARCVFRRLAPPFTGNPGGSRRKISAASTLRAEWP